MFTHYKLFPEKFDNLRNVVNTAVLAENAVFLTA